MELKPVIIIVTEGASSPELPTERAYAASIWTITDDGLLHISHGGTVIASYNPHCWNSVRYDDATRERG